MGAQRGLAVFAILAALLAVSAIALTPFRDHAHACGAPITAAAHGQSVRVMPFFTGPAPEIVREQIRAASVTICRDPARNRLVGSAGVAIVMLTFALRWSVLDPRRRYPVYAGASFL